MGQGFKPRREGADGFAEQIANLQRQIDALRGAAPIRNSTVSEGGVTIYLDEDSNQVVKLGQNSAGSRGAAFTSPAGIDMLNFFISPVSGQATLTINDQGGDTAFSTDNDGAGSGIFWPLVPVPFADVSNTTTWPSNSTGSFVTIMQAGSEHFSQGLFVAARVVCLGGATAGEVRLRCDGNVIGSVASVGTSVTTVTFRGLAGGIIRSDAFLEIQARVTAGAGTCRAQVFQACWNPYVLSI